MTRVVRVKDASGNTIASQEIDPDDEGIPGEVVLEEGQTVEVLEASGEKTAAPLLDDQEEISGEAVPEEEQSVKVMLRDATGSAIATAQIDSDSEEGVPCEACFEE